MQVRQEIMQKVIDFEHSKGRTAPVPKGHSSSSLLTDQNKFGLWTLNDKINKLTGASKVGALRWVGSNDNSLNDSFVYCLVKGFETHSKNNGSQFMLFKHGLY